MSDSWSETEVTAIVEDYFSMLALELQGIPYNKTKHRKALASLLNNRSDGSIEFKHQNISAILNELGMPAIAGYKPRSNYQKVILPDVVLDWLAANPELTTLVSRDVDSAIEIPTVEDILSLQEEAPSLDRDTKPRIERVKEPANPYTYRTNYLEREAANKSLGDAGEQFAINFERARLISLGKVSLADKIEHVARTQGDGAGFDIRSYESNGADRLIEVKTTKYGKYSPFFISANELDFSKQHADAYHLYRLFQFRNNPRLFCLPGSVTNNFILTATEYRASLS